MVRFASGVDSCPSQFIKPHVWNLLNKDQVLLYVVKDKVEGMLVLFDAGHRILFLDNLAASSQPAAVRLIEHAYGYARQQGIRELYFASSSEGLKRFAEAHKATIFNNVSYTAFVPVR